MMLTYNLYRLIKTFTQINEQWHTLLAFSCEKLCHREKAFIQKFLVIIVMLSANCQASILKPTKITIQNDQAEQELIQILDLIQAQKTESALFKSNQLLEKFPNFKLLKAVQADLFYSQYNKLNEPLNLNKNQQHQKNFISEASARLDSISDSSIFHQQHIPNSVKLINHNISHFFVIDFSKSRLYLFKNRKNKAPELIIDHYLTIGEKGYNKQVSGDKKTPLGVYYVTSFIADKQLPELYGWGAFPINYPNAWDKIHHRTGSGIWLHGVPRNTYSRPPLDSKGCLVLSNNFLIDLAKYLKIKTPVILTQSINWVNKKNYMKNGAVYQQKLLSWKKAWQNKDIKKYLSFYSKKFNNGKKNYSAWAKHKRRIFAKAKKIDLKIEQLSIFAYPGEENLLSVSFYQRYQSGSYRSKGFKQQYWKQESDGQWRIIYEL